jgi:WD40 repeat protein
MELRLAMRTSGLFLFSLTVLPLLCSSRPDAPPPSELGSVTETARMQVPRASHTSTLLPGGKILIAGGFAGSGSENNPYRSTELYDPRTRSFQPAGNMTIGRAGHTATLLKNGKVLITGGWTGRYDVRRAAELYDPTTGIFTLTGNLIIERADNTSTLLPDGRVLVAGGVDRHENALASAELYDPVTGTFTLTGDMAEPRGVQTATALKNGKVLIVGGGSGHYPSQTVYRSAELYDPTTGKFTSSGQMTAARHKHAAVLLPSGKVLIVGGSDNRDWRGEYSSAELYDPATGAFSATGAMNTSRFKLPEAVVLLPNRKVLIAGGGSFAEVYDETTGIFSKVSGSLGAARFFASATVLPDGKTLITGGYADSGGGLPATASAWIYRP